MRATPPECRRGDGGACRPGRCRAAFSTVAAAINTASTLHVGPLSHARPALSRLSAAHQRLSGAWSGSIDAPTGPRGPSCRPRTGSGAASWTAGSPPTACQPARADRPTSARIRAVSALAAGAVGDGRRVEIMGGTVPGGPGRLGTPGTQRRRALQDLSGRRRSGPRRSPWRASGSYG